MNLFKKIRIAYVEDHAGVRESVCQFLSMQAGLEIILDTDDGNDLLSYIKDKDRIPAPSICIIDVSMPKMDGITLLKEIRKLPGRLPCLFYSMHNNTTTIAKAIYLGANGYLSKDYHYQDLYQAVVDISNNGIAYTPDADQELFKKIQDHTIQVNLLSPRERYFTKLAASGHTDSEIASIMNIRGKTLETYRSRCYSKLKVNNRVELTVMAFRLGIINL